MKMRFAFEAMGMAILVVAMLTPLVLRLALRLGAVSPPGGRHVHERSMPRLGGLAICVAFVLPLVGIHYLEPEIVLRFEQLPYRWLGLIGGGVLMCAVGVVDDTRGLRAIHKLYAQIAVGVFAFASGFTIHTTQLPLLGEVSMGVFALPVTVLWIVGVINAVNLIDGLDGLAAGVVFFAAATNFVVAYVSDNAPVALLSGATAGAVLGFLFYNFNPARIFMGDSGSYFLGYVLAVTSLIGTSQKASTAVSLLVPVVALGVPIFDTLFAMARRFLERRPVFSPDRGHIHHRMLDMGITHRRAVLILYGVCVLFTISAIGISLGRSWQIGAAMLAASVVLVGLVRFVGYFEYLHLRTRQKARLRSRDSEMLRYAIPRVPELFAGARTEAELLVALVAFAKEADLEAIEVVTGSGDGERAAFEWSVDLERASLLPRRLSRPGEGDAALRDQVSARFPLGRDGVARAAVRFAWHSDTAEVEPQSEILLQVAADVLAGNLLRLKSALAPEAELVAVEAPAGLNASSAQVAAVARPGR